MTQHLKPIPLAAVFLVGCAVGGAASRFAVPPANAQQQAATIRYEYMCFSEMESEKISIKANQMGQQHWEMVTAGYSKSDGTSWCFKRPAIGGPPQPAQ